MVLHPFTTDNTLSFPSSNHLADVHCVNASLKTIVPLLWRVVAEVLLGLMPDSHGLAFDDQVGFLVIGCAVFSVGYMQAEGSGLVAIATAVATHVLPYLRVVELHDGETRVLLHKLPGVASVSHIDRHCWTVVAQIVADATPADGHGVAFSGVARAYDEVLGEPSEAVLLELLLYVESGQFVVFLIHGFVVLFLLLRTGTADEGNAEKDIKVCFH